MNRGLVGGVVGAGLMLAAGTAWGQAVVGEPTNAAKTFATNCAMCHNSPRGLAKDDRSLSGFLLQHYTTGPQMSAAMAAYLASAGRGAPPKEGREKGQRDAAPRDPTTSREAAAPREGREKSQRDAAPREPAPREARTGEDGAEKQAPAKRTEPRKQQSAKASPEAPKRRQHDSAPAVDAVRPAEPEKPTVEAAKPVEAPKAPESELTEGAPAESKPAESIRLDAPRQEAAAPAPVPAASAAPQPAEAAPAVEAAPAHVPATASVPAKADQPSFSSPLP